MRCVSRKLPSFAKKRFISPRKSRAGAEHWLDMQNTGARLFLLECTPPGTPSLNVPNFGGTGGRNLLNLHPVEQHRRHLMKRARWRHTTGATYHRTPQPPKPPKRGRHRVICQYLRNCSVIHRWAELEKRGGTNPQEVSVCGRASFPN